MSAIICGPRACPSDPNFEHDNYFGCIPVDFNARSGRSKKYQQTLGPDGRWHWSGGCAAVRLAALTEAGEP